VDDGCKLGPGDRLAEAQASIGVAAEDAGFDGGCGCVTLTRLIIDELEREAQDANGLAATEGLARQQVQSLGETCDVPADRGHELQGIGGEDASSWGGVDAECVEGSLEPAGTLRSEELGALLIKQGLSSGGEAARECGCSWALLDDEEV
jgi:hypothetical protein